MRQRKNFGMGPLVNSINKKNKMDKEIWLDIQPLINGKLLLWYLEDNVVKTLIF